LKGSGNDSKPRRVCRGVVSASSSLSPERYHVSNLSDADDLTSLWFSAAESKETVRLTIQVPEEAAGYPILSVAWFCWRDSVCNVKQLTVDKHHVLTGDRCAGLYVHPLDLSDVDRRDCKSRLRYIEVDVDAGCGGNSVYMNLLCFSHLHQPTLLSHLYALLLQHESIHPHPSSSSLISSSFAPLCFDVGIAASHASLELELLDDVSSIRSSRSSEFTEDEISEEDPLSKKDMILSVLY
jgi:hypothetical protein